jgi:hypothetical protein
MSNSTVVEWLNENSYRAYPLTAESTRFFNKNRTDYDLFSILLDAHLAYASWPSTEPAITKMVTGATDLTISVTGQSAFVLADFANASYPAYIRNSEYSLIVLGEPCKTLPINSTINLSAAVFEHTVSTHLPTNMLGASSLNVLGSGNLTGVITLTEGYQTSLTPTLPDALQIEVGRNEGVPLPCRQVYSVDDDCATIVSSINGVTANKTGGKIQFVAGRHINIFSDKINNRIYIGFDFTSEDVPEQQFTSPPKAI